MIDRFRVLLVLSFTLVSMYLYAAIAVQVNQLRVQAREAQVATVKPATHSVTGEQTNIELSSKIPLQRRTDPTACVHGRSTRWFLGSIRISKTGSTSLEHALHVGFKNVHRLPRFFPAAIAPPKTLADLTKKVPEKYHADSCYYSYDAPKTNNQSKDAWKPHQEEGHCPHMHANGTVKHFQQRLKYLKDDDEHRENRLQLFTMIRDPFEHLASFFYYSKTIFPSWSGQHTKAQNECVEKGDFVCWLTLLHQEGSQTFAIPNQFGQFGDKKNLTGALRLISPETNINERNVVNGRVLPEVVVLINECMEASVRLLVDLIPQVFHGDKADLCSANDVNATTIPATATADRNEIGETYRDKRVVRRMETYLTRRRNVRGRPTQAKKDSKAQNATQWLALREQAKLWFPDDFAFYKASVRQFRAFLVDSKTTIHPIRVNECVAKLDAILEEI